MRIRRSRLLRHLVGPGRPRDLLGRRRPFRRLAGFGGPRAGWRRRRPGGRGLRRGASWLRSGGIGSCRAAAGERSDRDNGRGRNQKLRHATSPEVRSTGVRVHKVKVASARTGVTAAETPSSRLDRRRLDPPPSAYPVGGSWGDDLIGVRSSLRNAVPVTWNNGNHAQCSIVCGLDGSDGARAALRVAAPLAENLGLRLVVAHVVQPQPTARGLGPTAGELAALPLDTLLAGGESLVEGILEQEQLGDAERRVLLGFAADRLADLADDEAAALIVVGSRGRRGFKAAWLGSVSADVIGVARCPVLVVPPGAATDGRQTSSAAGAGVPGSPAAP